MIFRANEPAWKRQFRKDVADVLVNVHTRLTNIAALLRNTSVDIWTQTPGDPDLRTAERNYSLQGWRVHHRQEHARLNTFMTNHGTQLQGYDAPAHTALTGYLASIANLAPAFQSTIANYFTNGSLIQQRVTQADRNTLATAIEAELQP